MKKTPSAGFYKQYTLKLSLFPINLLFDVFTNRIKSYAGTSQKIVLTDFEKGKSKGYFVREDFHSSGNKIAEKIVSKKLLLKKVLKDFEKRNKKLLKVARKANKVNKKTTNLGLNKLFKAYCKAYSDAYIPAAIPFMCDFSLEKMASKQLKKEFGFEKATKLITVLSVPAGFSWETKNKLELTKLALKAKKKKITLFKEFKKSKFWKDFEKHIKEWKWLPYDYEGNQLEKKEFEKILKECLKKPEKIIKAINSEKIKVQKTRKKAKKTKGVKMALLLGELAYFKEYRKGLMSKSLYLMEPLLKEISKRIGVKLKESRYLFAEELEKALSNPKKWRKELKKRWNYSVYVQKGKKQFIYVGLKGKKFMKNLNFEKPEAEIKGTIACMGKVSGKVKIIFKPSDLSKMKKGNILVSPMTTPDLVPAIKKAAAIVTDTGGMTSHAAIISREFGIPCIIGTQHATDLLKDNDLIEVDAKKGIIKKLK